MHLQLERDPHRALGSGLCCRAGLTGQRGRLLCSCISVLGSYSTPTMGAAISREEKPPEMRAAVSAQHSGTWGAVGADW